MKAIVEGYTFDFPKATSITKFDGDSHHMTHAMKAVDVLIELPEWRFFVEVKDYELHCEWTELLATEDKKQKLEKLRSDLVYKYRDSFLYHWCQKAEEKKNAFVFLTDWSDAVKIVSFKTKLKGRFPTSDQQCLWSNVWTRTFVDKLFVVNTGLWSKSTLSEWGTIEKP